MRRNCDGCGVEMGDTFSLAECPDLYCSHECYQRVVDAWRQSKEETPENLQEEHF